LEFPDWETPKDAERYTAVQLFLQSARRNQPDFALRNDADLTHLARICRLVAGMPLALELAAAWVDMLPLAEIAAGLQQGLDFLETDMRDVPERHRSVRAAIDYSWHKLTEQERDIFAKLSVFRGGFTRQAAQAVAGANLRQLGRLVNKSFLQYAQASDRYQVHELMRKYGLEKLQESDQEAEVRDQHSRFFCNALQEWQTGLDSSQMRQTAAEIEADYPNVLVAWEFALVQGHHKRLVSVVNVLGTYFDVNGRWLEGIKLFQESLKLLQTTPGLLTTEAAVRLGIWLSSWWGYLVFVGRTNFAEFHFVYQHILPSGLELLEHPLLSGVDSRAEEAFLRLQLAYALVIDAPRIEEGRAHLTIAIRLYQELGNLSGFADALGIIYFYYTDREMLLKTQEQLQEILVSLRQQNQPRQLILTLRNLGQMDRGLKAYDKMIDHLNEAYTIAQLSGDVIKMIETRNLTINILYNLGYFDLALEYSEELLTVAEQTHSTNHKALAFSLVGAAQVYRGQFLLAIEILQEAIRYDNENVPSSGEEVISLWVSVGLPQAYLHTGQYEKALAWITNRRPEWHLLAYQTWIPLIQEVYEETLALAQQSLALLSTPHRVGQPEIFTPEALALYQLGRIHEAKARLHLSLQICLEIRESFLQLMALIPVIARVLTDGEDAGQKERAVELWAMAQALPFVGNSQLFADLLSQPLAKAAAELPAEVVAAAQVRGQELDWWQTAETLLTELTELGWNKQTD
jgi:tetratricopeptide (TPR) repeat protein